MTIQLWTAATPNGQKTSIALEEFGVEYTVNAVDLSKNEQKSTNFIAINPNGRIPAIVDLGREDFPVFESGAIFMYLCTHYDESHKFSFSDPNEQSQMIQWLFFQNAGLGPMQGQANHFFRYAPEKIQYGIDRYQNETRRLYGVLERHLQDRKYLVGDKYSVADMAMFPWVRWEAWAGIGMDNFPRLKQWCDNIESRPAVQKGLQVPGGDDQIVKLRQDPNVKDPFQKWVMQGQDEIREQHGKKS